MKGYCCWCNAFDETVESIGRERVCLDCRFEPDYIEHVHRVAREARRRDREMTRKNPERLQEWWCR